MSLADMAGELEGGAPELEGSDALSLIGEIPGGIEDLPFDPAAIIVLLVLPDAVSREPLRVVLSRMLFGSISLISRDDIMNILPIGVARIRPQCGK